MSVKIPILSVYDADGNQIEIPTLSGKSARSAGHMAGLWSFRRMM